jgi:hypothetical protein
VESPTTHYLRTSHGWLKLVYRVAPEDFYDGDRSILSLFGLAQTVDIDKRADLNQLRLSGSSEKLELTRLFYNTLLLEEWHAGRLPEGVYQSDNFREDFKLERRAEAMATQALVRK